MDGKLNEYLYEVDEECHVRVEMLVEQMKAEAGITEELKVVNQMKWVGLQIISGLQQRKLCGGK